MLGFNSKGFSDNFLTKITREVSEKFHGKTDEKTLWFHFFLPLQIDKL